MKLIIYSDGKNNNRVDTLVDAANRAGIHLQDEQFNLSLINGAKRFLLESNDLNHNKRYPSPKDSYRNSIFLYEIRTTDSGYRVEVRDGDRLVFTGGNKSGDDQHIISLLKQTIH